MPVTVDAGARAADRLQALLDAHHGWHVDADMREVLADRARLVAENRALAEQISFGVYTEDEWRFTEPEPVAAVGMLAERYGAGRVARIAAYVATHTAADGVRGGSS